MASTNLIIDQVSTVDTVQRFPLGTLYEEPAGFGTDRDPAVSGSKSDRGRRIWIYVFNDSGSSIVRGTVCCRKALTTTYNVRAVPTTTVPSAGIVGIGDHTIATANYGWLIREGMAEVIADTGGLTAENGLVPGGAVAGTADTSATLTDGGFGVTTETVLATALATCLVNCRG